MAELLPDRPSPSGRRPRRGRSRSNSTPSPLNSIPVPGQFRSKQRKGNEDSKPMYQYKRQFGPFCIKSINSLQMFPISLSLYTYVDYRECLSTCTQYKDINIIINGKLKNSIFILNKRDIGRQNSIFKKTIKYSQNPLRLFKKKHF